MNEQIFTPPAKPLPRLDVARLVRDLGGANEIVDNLRKHVGLKITRSTIYKWVERDSMPLDRFVCLVVTYRAMKNPIPMDRYIRTGS